MGIGTLGPGHFVARIVGLIVLLMATVGCTHGTGNYQDIRQLRLGITPAARLTELFGEPQSRRSMSKDNESYEWLTYSLSASNGEARVLSVETSKGVLNGYNYISTADADRTHAAVSAASEIKAGVTTKDEVARLLGEPTGRIRLPSGYRDFREFATRTDLAEAWIWMELTDTNFWMTQARHERGVYVIFDRAGKVFRSASFDRPLPVYVAPVRTQTYYVPQYQPAPAKSHHK